MSACTASTARPAVWSRNGAHRRARLLHPPGDKVPEEFWDIGVRIEDDVLVTAAGNENLTGSTPKTVADVEAACAR